MSVRNLALLLVALVAVPTMAALHRIHLVSDSGVEKLFDWFEDRR